MQKYIFSVDVEVSGMYLNKNGIVGLGATFIEIKTGKILSTFKEYLLLPEDREWELREDDYRKWEYNEELKLKVKEEGCDPRVIIKSFVTWFDRNEVYLGFNNIKVVSDNPGFDFAWLDLYLSIFTLRPPMYYGICGGEYKFRKIWCTDSICHGILLERTGESHDWNLDESVGCVDGTYKNDHDPLNDALNIALNHSKYLNSISIKQEVKQEIKQDIKQDVKQDVKQEIKQEEEIFEDDDF